jgi:hypothetical protein
MPGDTQVQKIIKRAKKAQEAKKAKEIKSSLIIKLGRPEGKRMELEKTRREIKNMGRRLAYRRDQNRKLEAKER